VSAREHTAWPVRNATTTDVSWIERVLTVHWGGRVTVVNEQTIDLLSLSTLVAGKQDGIAIFKVAPQAELLLLHAMQINVGIGSALLNHLTLRLFEQRVKQLWVTTTNDNLQAIAFYERRGFRLEAVRAGAVDRARRCKPDTYDRSGGASASTTSSRSFWI
jgi:N-acetylglutamate synthase-like GNAT family acetyltransferase